MQNKVIVTFHTTAEAMETESVCHERKIPGKLISAPRELTADCGIAWCGPLETEAALRKAVSEAEIEVAGIYTDL